MGWVVGLILIACLIWLALIFPWLWLVYIVWICISFIRLMQDINSGKPNGGLNENTILCFGILCNFGNSKHLQEY